VRTILVLAPYVPHPATHGGSIRSRVLLDALRTEYRVVLAAPVAVAEDRARLRGLADLTGIEVRELPGREPAASGPLVKVRQWLLGRSELLRRRWAAAAPAVAAALAAATRPDLVVADSTFALPVTPPGGALLLHLHNLEHAVLLRRDGIARPWAERLARAWEGRAIAATERRAIARARCTITVSEEERAAAAALVPGARVACVPNTVGVDSLPLLPPPAAGGPIRLLFVGAMDYPPNHEAVAELVLRHLPVLRREFPGLVVRLVGRDAVGRLVAFRGLDGVEIVGDAEDLLPHYACSHAVYLPIRSGGGTRIKILEAWALGRPVLATAVAAEAIPAVEGVHWRRFETPEEGARALRQVLGAPGAAMAQAARALVVQRFAHPVALAALRDVVGSLFSDR
jgi:glycosyltransferase involved in cell wall biosynthesis